MSFNSLTFLGGYLPAWLSFKKALAYANGPALTYITIEEKLQCFQNAIIKEVLAFLFFIKNPKIYKKSISEKYMLITSLF